MTPDRDPTAPLIGRDAERARIARVVESVAAGEKRGVVLRADPGQGKSALLRAAVRDADRAGLLVATARTPAGVPLPPMFPVGELIGGLAAAMREASLPVPDALTALAGSDEPPSAPHLAAALEEVCRVRPAVLVVDDYHWTPAEGSSLLIAALRAVEAGVGLLASVRTRESDGAAWTEPPRSSADLALETIEIAGLDAGSVGLLAGTLLDAPMLPSAAETLRESTFGNPLHVIESVRGGTAEGWLQRVEGHWTIGEGFAPRSVLEAIGARLERLDERALAVAGTLAILGRPAVTERVAGVAGLSPDETTASLALLVDEGLAGGSPAEGGYMIAHPLYGEAVLEALGSVRRGSLHGRAFDVLHGEVGVAASERAFHAIHAGRRPDDLQELMAEAAREAQRAGSPAQAALWFERLAAATDDETRRREALIGRAEATARFDPGAAAEQYADLAAGVSGARRARLLSARATVLQRLGRFDEGLGDLEEALPLAEAADVFAIEDGIAVIHLLTGRRDEAEERLLRLTRAAEGTPDHARALFHLAAAVAYRGDVDGLIEHSRRGLDVCQDAHLRRSLRNNFVWGLMLRGRWDEAEAELQPAIKENEEVGDYWNLLPILCNSALLYAWKGDSSQALDLAVRSQAIANRLGGPMDKIKALECTAVALLEAGEPAGAVRIFADVRDMLGTPEAREVDYTFMVMAEAHLAIDDVGGAESYNARAESLLQSDSLIWAESIARLKAQIALARGDADGALRLTAEWMDRPGPVVLENVRTREVAGHALHKAGDRQAAHARVSEAASAYERLGAARRAGAARAWTVVNGPKPLGRPRSSRAAGLTEREFEILGLVVQGKTNREIAADLVLSPSTVKKHVERVLAKTGASRRAELASVAIRLGIPIEPLGT